MTLIPSSDPQPSVTPAATAPAVPTVVPRPKAQPRLRIKNLLLGKPLHTDDLMHERLGKPTGLAIFASDNLSSSAYATEEILHVLVPAVGIAAFSLVLPITLAMILVLAFLILSYRQTIKSYRRSGGAYMVTKFNFGERAATFAGSALLIAYVLTVAVSSAAGTAALTSAVPSLRSYRIVIAVVFIVVIAYGNLRGVRESGKIFAAPTYFFMANMAILLGVGFYRWIVGDLPKAVPTEGMVHFGSPESGVLMGASLFVLFKAYASGGAAVTGVEAIADGVLAFREPAWRNARTTLVIMGTCLGVMFIGISALAAATHASPFESGTPTVLSEIGRLVYGNAAPGDAMFYALQIATVLILILAANTSFADFPRLANFAAEDRFLPRWLMNRGHRLGFSNGVIGLAAASVVVVVATGAQVSALIPLYAVGVFASFVFSQASMTKHHLTHREPGWRWGLFVNGFGGVLSLGVLAVIIITKFSDGAWMILVAVPLSVYFLGRTRQAYAREGRQLDIDIQETFRPPMPRHRVVVLVGKLDRATLAALQYARQLRPLSTVALHVAVDPDRAAELKEKWGLVGVPITLQVLHCPDRNLIGTVEEYVHELASEPGTEVTVLLPERRYFRSWHRLLHDVDAGRLTKSLNKVPHVNLTVVPFHLTREERRLEVVR